MDTSADVDKQLQLALAASLGLELPPPSPDHPPRIRSSSSSNLQQAGDVNFINQFSRLAPSPDTSPGIQLVSVTVKPFDA